MKVDKGSIYYKHGSAEGVQSAEGVTRTVVGYNDNLMLVRFDFKKGAIGTPHAHEAHTQSSYVYSGKFEVELDGVKKVLVAGDGFFTNPNGKHGVVCLEEGSLIDVFSPVRKDFL